MRRRTNTSTHHHRHHLDHHDYTDLARADGRYRWWRPLLVAPVALLLYGALLLVSAVLALAVGTVVPAVRVAVDGFAESDLDPSDPVGLVVAVASVALALPALLGATRLVGSRPVGLLSSVTGRLRRGWLGWSLLLALAVHVPVLALVVAVEAVTGTLRVHPVPATTGLAVLLAACALVPLQAAAEEYVFRGYLVQTIGGWLRHPAAAVVLPVPVFVLGHGYDLAGSVEVAAFAVTCGWLAWRTGGLEAPVAAHVVNNALLMALGALGVDPSMPGSDRAGLLSLGASLVTMVVLVAVVTRRADALGVVRTRSSVRGRAELPVPV